MAEIFVLGTWNWEELVNWYLALPGYGQVLCLLAAFAIIAFAVAIVYYIIKGVVYLVYYILKGVVYLVVGIFYGIYKLFEALYYLLTGKERPKKTEKKEIVKAEETQKIQEKVPPKIEPIVQFCSECGSKITDAMAKQLTYSGLAYCAHCGKGYKSGFLEIEI